jgi:hypothetical protein
MNFSWTTRASMRQWAACVAALAALLIGGLAFAPPAQAADLNGYGYEYPAAPYYPSAYRCNPCCNPCCDRCGGCPSCGCCRSSRVYERRVVERVIERGCCEQRFGRYPTGYEGRPPFPYGYGGIRSRGPYAYYDYPDVPRPPLPVPAAWPDGYYDGYGYGE